MLATVDGVRLFFNVGGAGPMPDGPATRRKPTVVMVHGGPGADHSVFESFSRLADMAQVVSCDHRGHGRSDPSDEAHRTPAQWGDDLKGLCDALGIERPIVIATSGGFVAFSRATRHPGHAAGLVPIGAAAKVDFRAVHDAFERGERRSAPWRRPVGRIRPRRGARSDACRSARGPDRRGPTGPSRTLWRHETAPWFDGPRNEHGRMDFRRDPSRITCAVLVMLGEEDPITPWALGEAIVAGPRGEPVTLRAFEDRGHGIVGDWPGEALGAIRRLVSTVAADA